MENSNTSGCLYCGRTSKEVPLISLEYQDHQLRICPQHIPILIHNPSELIGKLPGAEGMEPADHND